MNPSDRIIFPLDGMGVKEAEVWMSLLTGKVGYIKIGLEMFLRSGWDMVVLASKYKHKVMLDLKLHDIPATMEGATRQAVERGVSLLTVHAQAGREAMARCVSAAGGSNTAIVAVTVLTSLSEKFIQRVYQPARYNMGCIPNIVERLTVEATEAGVDWFVCSPFEAELVRLIRSTEDSGIKTFVITPGIRMADGDHHDQRRVNTPGAAVKAGADFLVIGRPIRESEVPMNTIEAICADIDSIRAQ